MRLRVGLALVLSFIFIAGASVARFTSTTPAAPSLDTALEPEFVLSTSTDLVADLVSAEVAPEEDLTTTDLVSRQLFADYFNLVSSGQATSANINSLAEAYAEAISKMAQLSPVLATDLNIVPDTKASRDAYWAWFVRTTDAYLNQVDEEFANAENIDEIGPDLIKLSSKVSSIYENVANSFKAGAVPQSLLADHLALTNNYFNSAAAYDALSRADKDPIEAVAGLSTAQQNDQAEVLLIRNIAQKLGIIASSQ